MLRHHHFPAWATVSPPQFTYQVTVTDGQATTPKFTFGAGAPSAVVDFGDGTAPEAVTSGVDMSHAYTTGGTYTVKLIAPKQAQYLTQIDIGTDHITGVLTPIQMFPLLTYVWLRENYAWAQDISNWQPAICVNLETLAFQDTLVLGDISGWQLPPHIRYIRLDGTSLSGNVSSWIIPASLWGISMNFVPLIGCPILSSMVAIEAFSLITCSLSQATVDLWLSRCVAIEAQTTYATPSLDLSGNNAAPSAQGVMDKNTLVAAGWIITVTA